MQMESQINQPMIKREDTNTNEFKVGQVKMESPVNQVIKKEEKNTNEFKVGQVQMETPTKGKDEQKLNKETNIRRKFRLNQKQLEQIYRKSREQRKEESNDDAKRLKQENKIDDSLLVVGKHQKIGDILKQKQKQMDKEQKQKDKEQKQKDKELQDQWRNELIREHRRKESLQVALRLKQKNEKVEEPVLVVYEPTNESDDSCVVVEDDQKDEEQSTDEFRHKQEEMDKELKRIQEQWRNELIKDKVKFQVKMEEEERFVGESLTIGQKDESRLEQETIGQDNVTFQHARMEEASAEESQEIRQKLEFIAKNQEEERKRRIEQHDSDRREWLRQQNLLKQLAELRKRRLALDKESADYRTERQSTDSDEDSDNDYRRRRRSSDDDGGDGKRQRFLERNRAAATRCRNKRKQWITNLESKADELNTTNVKLQNEVTTLRNEVAQLKQLLLAHKDCPVTLMQRKAAAQAQVQIQAGSGTSDLQEPELMDTATTANMQQQPTVITVQTISANHIKQMAGPST
ncbi:uncharacterized protein [Amphiura filiformis]|uniref:uncharacterized protein isoform X4 n=1 Tax=Amphiura filiformis TaxID=82378 RepID=UPI003B20C882